MQQKPDIAKKIFRKIDEIVDRKIADETILVPLKGKLVDMQKIFSLNPVADFIWEKLDGKKDVAEICRLIEEDFKADTEQINADVNAFLNELTEAELIVEVKV